MPATHEPIASFTVSGSSTNPVTFNNIPQTFTDLMLVIYGRSTGTVQLDTTLAYVNFNTGTNNYSNTNFYTDGSSIVANRATNQVYFGFGAHPAGGATANVFGTEVFHILNYTNSTAFKTVLSQASSDLNGSGQMYMGVHLWRQTAAITRLDMYTSNPAWAAGSKLTLYGIKAA